ncbi:MAG: 2-hydroxy-3-oxopropionate reductase [Gammaproteobacteria bacterium]|nr:2-hydroxy-3-oxopropionate reductase [Gammaproteobacteria bacterium]
MKNIGFIGLGIMGKPMAENLIKAGYTLHVYARKPKVTESLVAAGAKAYSSPLELAPHADIIITMVQATHDVEEVILGKQGLIQTAKPGTIIIDMSTISAKVTQQIAKKLAAKKIDMLDAPVSGGEQGAIDGTLTIMVGGEKNVLSKALPVLKTLGKKITHIGDIGTGQVAKACNQIIVAETIVAVSEALRLAKASGADPAKVREALLGGYANSRILEVHGQRMLEDDYKPGFKANLHRKDMHLALEQAHVVTLELPAAHYAMQCIDRLVMKGHGELDSSAIHSIIEE